MTKNEKLIEKLRKMGACDSALNWIQENKFESIQEAWDKCERGSWMEWLIVRLQYDDWFEIWDISTDIQIYCNLDDREYSEVFRLSFDCPQIEGLG